MVDYANLRTVATRLIGENGRTVTLARYSRLAEDPAKPWRGPATDGTQPDVTISVFAVIIPPDNNQDAAGTLVRRNNFTALVDSASVESATTESLLEFDILTDANGDVYKITSVNEYKPGPSSVMYELVLEQ